MSSLESPSPSKMESHDSEKADVPSPVTDEVPPYLRASADRGLLGTLRRFEAALDRRLGVEPHGIARRRPEDKDPSYASWSNQAVMFLLWMSATMNLSCFATGFLGWEFGLDLSRSIAIVVGGTLAGSAVTVSCAVGGNRGRGRC
jgi:hypothetical protein